MYVLPQGGMLANKIFIKDLATYEHYKVPFTPGHGKSISRPIQFTLVIDDFAIKFVQEEHANHLIMAH